MTRIARIPQRDTRLAWRRRVLVSLGGVLCLSSSTTLKAGSVAPQRTPFVRRSAAEEEKCRLTLAATCDTAHPKRQNAAERGRALYRGRTRAERFCNRCGGFIKRAPRPRREPDGAKRRWVAFVGSLRAPRSVAVRSLQLLALALPRFFWARRPAPAFASPRTFSPWRQPLCSRVLAASCNVGVNIDVVIKTWR